MFVTFCILSVFLISRPTDQIFSEIEGEKVCVRLINFFPKKKSVYLNGNWNLHWRYFQPFGVWDENF